MRNYDKPDPLFQYDLDARWWSAIRREMADVDNKQDAAIGVAAVDAFVSAVDHPPPTNTQLDTIIAAVNCGAITVARNAGHALGVLAIAHAIVRDRMRVDWPGLTARGRWAMVWQLRPATSEMDALLRHFVGLGFHDRAGSIRAWAARIVVAREMREFVPEMERLIQSTPPGTRRDMLERDLDILQKGFFFEPDSEGPFPGMMYINVLGSGVMGFTVTHEWQSRFGLEHIGLAAAQAGKDPSMRAFRAFEQSLDSP